MIEGQYTLDADPMALANRVRTLENAVDVLCGAVVDLTRSLLVISDQCDKALCEDRPLQAKAIYDEHERLVEIGHRAHGASVMMGRSY